MTLCLRGFSLCKCDQCRIIKSYNQTELRLREVNDQYNKTSKQFTNHKCKCIKCKCQRENGFISYSLMDKKTEHDNKHKLLFSEMIEYESKARKLIYRLNSLEKKADLYGINLNEVLLK